MSVKEIKHELYHVGKKIAKPLTSVQQNTFTVYSFRVAIKCSEKCGGGRGGPERIIILTY